MVTGERKRLSKPRRKGKVQEGYPVSYLAAILHLRLIGEKVKGTPGHIRDNFESEIANPALQVEDGRAEVVLSYWTACKRQEDEFGLGSNQIRAARELN